MMDEIFTSINIRAAITQEESEALRRLAMLHQRDMKNEAAWLFRKALLKEMKKGKA